MEEFHEEAADLEVSLEVMMLSPWVQVERINHYYDEHLMRWRDRLGIEEKLIDWRDIMGIGKNPDEMS